MQDLDESDAILVCVKLTTCSINSSSISQSRNSVKNSTDKLIQKFDSKLDPLTNLDEHRTEFYGAVKSPVPNFVHDGVPHGVCCTKINRSCTYNYTLNLVLNLVH